GGAAETAPRGAREVHRAVPPQSRRLASALGVFTLNRIAETWRRWWSDPRARVMRRAALASAMLPVLGLAAAVQSALALRRLGVDLVAPLVRSAYSQERLARVATTREPGARRSGQGETR